MFRIVNLFIVLSLTLSFFTATLPNLAAEEELILVEQTQSEEDTSIKWTETLRLRDFYLSDDTIELRNKLKEYQGVLENTYKEHPSVFSTAVQYGSLLVDLGEIDKAKVVWDRAMKDFVSNPVPLVYRAWAYACKGDYITSKNTWYPIAMEKVNLGISGFDARVWLPFHVDAVLGLYLIKDYLPEKDKKEVTEAVLNIAKHFANSYKFAAILINEDLRAGRLQAAEKKINNILKRYPDQPTTLTLAGVLNLLKGNHQEALTFFDKANEFYPFSPTNHLMKARTLFAMDRKKESKAIVKKLEEEDPTWDVSYGKKVKINKLLIAESYMISPDRKIKFLKKH